MPDPKELRIMGMKIMENLIEKRNINNLKLQIKIQEFMLGMYDNYVDPSEKYLDHETGEIWNEVSENYLKENKFIDFSSSRKIGRKLALENEFAQNALLNRVAFTVGTGLNYVVSAKDKSEESKKIAEEAQKLIENFIYENNWNELEQELVEREDRDGEWFLRKFSMGDGTIQIRIVEPSEVFTPKNKEEQKNISFGILTENFDAQKVVGYFINNKKVSILEIIHRKANVDSNVMRGISTLWSIRDNFIRAEKLQRNMSTVAAIQSSLVAVRKFNHSTNSQIQDFIDKKSNNLMRNNRNNDLRIDKWDPGTILNMGSGQDLEFIAKGLDSSKFIPILQSELRSIAARFVMPEFMLTSNASNANYASTMVAETPAIRQFQKMQFIYKNIGKKVMKWVLDTAMLYSFLPENYENLIKINVEAPSLIVRDIKKEAEANKIKMENGILSPQTWSAQLGLNYKNEQENIIEHAELYGGFLPEKLPEIENEEN